MYMDALDFSAADKKYKALMAKAHDPLCHGGAEGAKPDEPDFRHDSSRFEQLFKITAKL